MSHIDEALASVGRMRAMSQERKAREQAAKRAAWEEAKKIEPNFTDLVTDLARVFGKHERVVLFKDKRRIL